MAAVFRNRIGIYDAHLTDVGSNTSKDDKIYITNSGVPL